MNTPLNDNDDGRDSISSVTSDVPIRNGDTAIKVPNRHVFSYIAAIQSSNALSLSQSRYSYRIDDRHLITHFHTSKQSRQNDTA